MGIENDIKTLQLHVRELHDKFDMHTWVQSWAPHIDKKDAHLRTCSKKCTMDHRVWRIFCLCGTSQDVYEQEYNAAAKRSVYDGY